MDVNGTGENYVWFIEVMCVCVCVACTFVTFAECGSSVPTDQIIHVSLLVYISVERTKKIAR